MEVARMFGCSLSELKTRLSSSEFTLWAGFFQLEYEEKKEAIRKASKRKGHTTLN